MEKNDLQDSGDGRKLGNKGDKSKPGDVEGSSSKLPDVIDPTMAVDSIKEHTATLVKTFRHCLSSLADSLYSQSIIPEDIYSHAQSKYLDSNERSRALVSCVEDRLEIQPSDFKKLVHILKSEPFLDTLGNKLVQSYCTLSSIPPARQPATISPAISKYAAYLKGVYRSSPISTDNKWPPTPSKSYIELATVACGYLCRDEFIGQTLRGNIEEVLKSRKEISIDEIMVPDKEGVAYLKLVLVEGAPGIGKSTLAWELCRRWEQGRMEKYSLTVLLRLREKEVQEIRNIAELFFSCQGKHKDVLLDEVSSSNGKGVLFILDGFDELPTTLQKEGFLVKLINGTFLPESTILVTSRPSATAMLLKVCCPQIQKRIEVLGFTQESVEEYATCIFSSEPEQLQGFKAFISASDNPAINSLMYVPLNAAIIVEIYRHRKSDHLLPHTLTQVYTQLCLTILNRHHESNHPSVTLVNKFKDLPSHLYQEFLKLSEIAFEGLRRQEVIFHSLPSDLVHFGFLDAVSSLYGGGSVSYNFLHLTLQEFFAAYHISHFSDDARLALLKECGSDERWYVVWRFVAGLTQFKFFEGHLNSSLFAQKYGENEILVNSLFVQCLYEANLKMERSRLFLRKNVGAVRIPCSGPNLLEWYALGYIIANLTTEISWNIHFISTEHIESLICGLKTSDTTSNNSNINELLLQSTSKLDVLLCLEHFPLRGITDLTLFFTSDIDHLTKLLPSMTSLRQLSLTFPYSQCVDKFIQQLSKTSVTNLKVENTDLTVSSPALRPLIDPVTGTLRELCVSRYNHCVEADDASLLDVMCAPSSLKSLKLGQPQHTSSLSLLQTNTCLTKLEIIYNIKRPPNQRQTLTDDIGGISHEAVEVIVGILEHNKTLEVFIVGDFAMPQDISVLSVIVEALRRNVTLRILAMMIHYNKKDLEESRCVQHLSSGAEEEKRMPNYDYIQSKCPELNCDSRIEWQQNPWIDLTNA